MKKLNFNYCVSLVIFLAFACISCGENANQSVSSQQKLKKNCRIIEHQMGETEVCGQPKRIVVLGPYLLEPLLSLDVQPVAYADHIAFHQGNYDNPSKQIPYLGKYIHQPIANVGIAYTPSIEAIVKAKPDLILSLDDNENQYQIFSQFAPTLMLSFEQPEENLKKIAQAVNREEKAEQLIQETQQKVEKAKQDFAKIVANYPQVLLLYAQDSQELFIDNSRGLCSSLIKELGFELVSVSESDSASNSRVPLSLEILPKLNVADSIILFGYNFKDVNQLKDTQQFANHQLSTVQQEWSKNAIAQSMTASQKGRVYYIPAYLCFGLPGALGTELYLNTLKKQLSVNDT